ncbi:hypothetical protein BIU88_06980 [Chlorobaculum limnaeum]|uniref:Uncharacterized protein n=1 Tax=Chlorobaculum limnaeum TaxID=274537 RepID=A0A1D8D2S3_CHLLM|nr:hypothetical protein BIU88_06980 [Chlorobaculum limnaeum]
MLQRKTSANISLFCNIPDAALDVEEFNIHPQVIHIPSTNHQPIGRRGFTDFSRQIRTKAPPAMSTIIFMDYNKLSCKEETVADGEVKQNP